MFRGRTLLPLACARQRQEATPVRHASFVKPPRGPRRGAPEPRCRYRLRRRQVCKRNASSAVCARGASTTGARSPRGCLLNLDGVRQFARGSTLPRRSCPSKAARTPPEGPLRFRSRGPAPLSFPNKLRVDFRNVCLKPELSQTRCCARM
jgi:hypothetical protein